MSVAFALSVAAVAARLGGAGALALFPLSGVALIPLAWLIGETTEHLALRLGGATASLLNATLGNAPELIISLLALRAGLPQVVRASLVGSVVSNTLLLLGLSFLLGGSEKIARPATLHLLGLVECAAIMLALLRFADRDVRGGNASTIALIVVMAGLVAAYIALTRRELHQRAGRAAPPTGVWPIGHSLLLLALATGASALVAEILVGSLEHFARAAHLSELFVAGVIVGIAGNVAEHGGAILLATRGRIDLATAIAVESGAQVAALVLPVVAVVSLVTGPPRALDLQPVELATLAGSVALTALVLARGRSSQARGGILIVAYAGCALAFFTTGHG